MILYLYAIVDRPGPAPRAGIGRERVRYARIAGFTVALGRLRAAPAATPPALRAHDRVVRALARASDAVLPFRFGTTVSDESVAHAVLEARRGALRRALASVAGCEQMTVRVFGARVAKARPASPSSSGRAYLMARVRARREALASLEPLREALAPFVRRETVEVADAAPIISVYHLIERGKSAAYASAARRAAARLAPARVSVSGPWPPYAFAARDAA